MLKNEQIDKALASLIKERGREDKCTKYEISGGKITLKKEKFLKLKLLFYRPP